jgi:splicing factor 3B subunit 1
MALDICNYRQVVETTVKLSQKAGVQRLLKRLLMSRCGRTVLEDGDGCFRYRQASGNETHGWHHLFLPGANYQGWVQHSCHVLGICIKHYLTQIVTTILWRLNNKSVKQCGEDQQLHTLSLVLFEQLGEEYPDTLGSIIATEGAIANIVGMTQMHPPDLLLCMTPILCNWCEKVQEASINLIGPIANCGANPTNKLMHIFAQHPKSPQKGIHH